MASLKDLAKKTTPSASKSDKPVGYINLKLMGTNIFSRPIWKESTSEVELFSEINEMALNSPEDLKTLFNGLFVGNSDLVEVEVTRTAPKSDVSMADLIAAMSNK